MQQDFTPGIEEEYPLVARDRLDLALAHLIAEFHADFRAGPRIFVENPSPHPGSRIIA